MFSGFMKNNSTGYDITFICQKGKDHFAEPILNALEKKYSIQYLFPVHKREYSHRQVQGRVVWVEWALKFARLVSKKRWNNKRVVVRLHRWEIDTEYMNAIQWNHIDTVLFVNNHFENLFRRKITTLVRTVTIPNAVSTDDYPLNPPHNTKKLLAYSLTFNPIKGYVELVRFFSKLVAHSDAFELTLMAGKPKKQKEIECLAEIKKNIQQVDMEKHIHIVERENIGTLAGDRKNVHAALRRHDAIISFSQLESFHYAFAEGLLCGLQGFYNAWKNPLIKAFWDPWGYDSEEAMIEGILAWSRLPLQERERIARKNREYVIARFGPETIGEAFERELFG